MKVTLLQTELFWEDRIKNLSHFDNLVDSINEDTDLVVLPEMFTTGFTMKPEELAEPWNGDAFNWLKKKSLKKNCILTGSVSVEDQGKYFNRLFWMRPDGTFETYDKRHLFRMAREDQHYTAGTKKLITQLGDWKILPLICYDLRFPVWSRNKFDKKTNSWDYDVLIFVANWPEVRSYAWKQLLIARAIENQCYVIGLNRVGKDGNGFPHSGDSLIVNPKGEILTNVKAHEECIKTFLIDKTFLDEFRTNFPAGLDADNFTLF